MITITDAQGNAISWSSAGSQGFKGVAQVDPVRGAGGGGGCGRKAQEHGMKTLEVEVKGPGSGRESALRALQAVGFSITSIRDVTPIPAQWLPPAQAAAGLDCRPRKRRRGRIGFHQPVQG